MFVYNYVLKSMEEYTAYDTLGKKIASWQVEDKIHTNCRNCGAPVRSCVCEYCGTTY